MTYDIHIATSYREAKTSLPELSLNVQQHAIIFCQHKERLTQFPLVDGMSNYYGDTAYLSAEKLTLKRELSSLAKIISHSESVSIFIKPMTEIVEHAIYDNREP